MGSNKRLLVLTVIAIIGIEIGAVWSVWGDVTSRRPDFADLFAAGEALSHGNIPDYTTAVKSGDLNASRQAAGSQAHADSLHPPFEMTIFMMLAKLSYTTAYRVWLICNLIMLWVVPWMLWHDIPNLHGDFHYAAILYGSFFFVIVALVQGQDSVLLLFLLTLAFVLVKRTRDLSAGVILGLGMFKFTLVLPMLVFLAISRKSKLVLGTAISFGGLLFISGTIIGFRNAVSYYLFLFRFAENGTTPFAHSAGLMPNLRGLIAILGLASSRQSIVITLAISAAIVLVTAVWAGRNRELPIALQVSLFIAVSVLCSFHFFVHNAVILLLPLLLAADQIACEGTAKRSFVTYGIAVCTMYAFPKVLPMSIGMPILAISVLVLMAAVLMRAKELSSMDIAPAHQKSANTSMPA